MTRRRLKPWVKNFFISLGITIVFFLFISIVNYFNREMEQHIERISKECASQGYGITANYTKEGDKYYVCKK